MPAKLMLVLPIQMPDHHHMVSTYRQKATVFLVTRSKEMGTQHVTGVLVQLDIVVLLLDIDPWSNFGTIYEPKDAMKEIQAPFLEHIAPIDQALRNRLVTHSNPLEMLASFGCCRCEADHIELVSYTRRMEKPKIVSAAEWQAAREELLLAEKAATRTLDAVAAQRRRLPMVRFDAPYAFDTAAGKKSLVELFEGKTQLVAYQFMDNGPDKYCPGCTKFLNNVPTALKALAEHDVAWVTVSNMPLAQIEAYKARMGWTVPFVSSRGTTFSEDCGAGRGFALSVFLRDGDDVYRTYVTFSRGVDRLVFQHSILDLTPYGRQEDWEDSPAGWPQRPTYG